MRETDTLVSTVDEIRPDIGVPHHVRRNRVERGTSTTLSEPFTIRSRETYRFHGSDPLPFHQGSLVDALFTTHVCVCVSSFPRSFSSLRIVSRTIEYLAWVVEPARILFLEKALPFLRCYFFFAPCQSRKRGNQPLCGKQQVGCGAFYTPLFMTGLPLRIISEWRYRCPRSC